MVTGPGKLTLVHAVELLERAIPTYKNEREVQWAYTASTARPISPSMPLPGCLKQPRRVHAQAVGFMVSRFVPEYATASRVLSELARWAALAAPMVAAGPAG